MVTPTGTLLPLRSVTGSHLFPTLGCGGISSAPLLGKDGWSKESQVHLASGFGGSPGTIMVDETSSPSVRVVTRTPGLGRYSEPRRVWAGGGDDPSMSAEGQFHSHHVHAHLCEHTYLHTRARTHIRIETRVYTSMHPHTLPHMWACTHTCTHTSWHSCVWAPDSSSELTLGSVLVCLW